MALDLNAFKSAPRKCETVYNGKTLDFYLDVDIITGDFLEKSRAAIKQQANKSKNTEDQLDASTEEIHFMTRILSDMVVSWSFRDKPDEKLPTEKEFFFGLPLPAINHFFTFAMEELAPKKKSGKA